MDDVPMRPLCRSQARRRPSLLLTCRSQKQHPAGPLVERQRSRLQRHRRLLLAQSAGMDATAQSIRDYLGRCDPAHAAAGDDVRASVSGCMAGWLARRVARRRRAEADQPAADGSERQVANASS
jgi:hypothetical protein